VKAPFEAELTSFAYEARDASGQVRWGVGIDTSILIASLRAVLSAAVRLATPFPKAGHEPSVLPTRVPAR
jgi:hypothetical protein